MLKEFFKNPITSYVWHVYPSAHISTERSYGSYGFDGYCSINLIDVTVQE